MKTLVASIALALVASDAAAQAVLAPGEWESTVATEIAASYTGPISSTSRSCYTSGDRKIYADKDAWAADMTKATGDGCKAQDVKQQGTALSMVLVCPENRRIELRHDFRGATGTMDAKSSSGDPGSTTTTHIELRRVAETCSEDTIEQWKQWNPGKPFEP